MMKIARYLLLFLALLVFIPSVMAQTGGQETSGSLGEVLPITLDSPVTVTLSGTTPVTLSFDAETAETVTITARSLEPEDALDPVLTLLDSKGTQLATNDDHGTDRTDLALRDSMIDQFALPAADTYTIEVAAYDANSQGDVEVTVTTGTGETGDASVTTLMQPQVIDDEVPNDGTYTYNFEGQMGTAVTITVRATDSQLDPKLTLLDSSGAEIASNDDHDAPDSSLGSLDSQILAFPLPKDDTYTIEITGFAGIGGTFELTIEGGEGGTETPGQPTPVATLASGEDTQVIDGTINSNETYTTSFTASAGDVYTITVQATSEDFDTRVSVYFDNRYVADNDDYGTNDPSLQHSDSRIYNMIIQESGVYEIDVHGYDDSAGSFTLTIDRVATGAPTGLPSESVELGTVKAGGTYTTTFSAQAGDYVTISVRGLTSDFDSYVALIDPDGTVLIDNDDHGSNVADLAFYDSRITNYHITADGTYTVEVSGYGDAGGTFGVTIGTLR